VPAPTSTIRGDVFPLQSPFELQSGRDRFLQELDCLKARVQGGGLEDSNGSPVPRFSGRVAEVDGAPEHNAAQFGAEMTFCNGFGVGEHPGDDVHEPLLVVPANVGTKE
jgi:hypothetical protein